MDFAKINTANYIWLNIIPTKQEQQDKGGHLIRTPKLNLAMKKLTPYRSQNRLHSAHYTRVNSRYSRAISDFLSPLNEVQRLDTPPPNNCTFTERANEAIFISSDY